MQKFRKWIYSLCILTGLLAVCTACGKADSQPKEETTEVVTDGPVSGPEDFKRLGMIIDVASSNMVKDVSYEIKNKEIACIKFVYNGIDCQFLASAVYSDFDLAGVTNTGTGDMLVSGVQGYNATYYKLNPGRVVFWSDTNIHYCLYIYVTAEDSVVDSILPLLSFEDHYDKREDVIEHAEAESKAFAQQIITVFQNKDVNGLSEILNYPQELGSGESIANIDELMAIPADQIFTDKLLEAVGTDAIDNLRKSRDGDAWLIGSASKNIYFRMTSDGVYKIVKINN